MKCIADTNVLFPLLVSAHPARPAAIAWWEQQADDSVGLCRLTQLAILRHLTNPIIMNGAPVSPELAWEAWSRLAEDPRCLPAPAPLPTLDERLLSLVRGRAPTPNLWTDAWLAAFADTLGWELVTFDRGFHAFGLTRLRVLSIP